MTENRDDFEHRLGQGLKRWAEAGEPTMDLETYITSRPPRRRTWLRWAGSAAAAVLLLTVGATFTFPSWAGTAAAWPFIGPVIQEMIMRDAGLKWAYDAGLIGEPLAEASHNGVTVRILAVVPDKALTTILYQITGLPEEPAPANAIPVKPERAGLLQSLARPVSTEPNLTVTKLPGTQGFFVGHDMPMRTPTGIYGTLTTNPISEFGVMEMAVLIDGQRLPMSFPVSRSAADGLTREADVKQSLTIGEVTYTVDSVIQTPVQTVVRYTVDKPDYLGSGYSWRNCEYSMALEKDGRQICSHHDFGHDGMRYAVFPRTELPARLVRAADVISKPMAVTWPLEANAVQPVAGVPVTLTEWERSGDRLGVRFEYHPQNSLVAFDGLEAVDSEGKTYSLKSKMSGWSGGHDGRPIDISHEFELAEGVVPVGIRATQAAVPVQGPWVFELPAP